MGFSIDHYLPQRRYPELAADYANLMWSCDMCNSYKGDAPTLSHAQRGYRFVRVDVDDPDDHLATSEASPTRLIKVTEEIGEYTIHKLNLNREPLRRVREIRERMAKSAEVMRKGLRSLNGQVIQDLPWQLRERFVALRRSLTARSEDAADLIDDALVRAANKSFLLDRPTECDQDARTRRAYLKKINAPHITGKSEC